MREIKCNLQLNCFEHYLGRSINKSSTWDGGSVYQISGQGTVKGEEGD